MSRAFPNLDQISRSIHRPPYGSGWLREGAVYEAHPLVTPEFISQACFFGRLVALREQPADVVWLRPHDGDWAGFEAAALDGRAAP